MIFEGNINIQAPREKVWEFLTDPARVSSCAPGVQSVEVVVPDKQFTAVAAVAFGSAKVTFETDVEWLEMYSPRFAKMKAHGKTPGSGVDVISEMRLTSTGGTTDLYWKADIIVVGQLASTAARLMSGITRSVTTAFFNRVKEQIEVYEVRPDTVGSG
jgi:carbon monoxide dehydrogenase subunit G